MIVFIKNGDSTENTSFLTEKRNYTCNQLNMVDEAEKQGSFIIENNKLSYNPKSMPNGGCNQFINVLH